MVIFVPLKWNPNVYFVFLLHLAAALKLVRSTFLFFFQLKWIIVLFFFVADDVVPRPRHSYLMLTLLTLRESWILIVFFSLQDLPGELNELSIFIIYYAVFKVSAH